MRRDASATDRAWRAPRRASTCCRAARSTSTRRASQRVAQQSRLTVLEEMQAARRVAA